ncbi:MAG TPA: 2OG-Fe(II) oxygenase [Gammaproteobacteria bacterium]|jgi:prolyl 4-hydroxylase|nr:2OG-Fe(II) oxygenase [Gammaproteobacteria bacterium]
MASNDHSGSNALARAEALDAQGRHDDAINELAMAAQRGDVEATTQLAKRIIVGDRAPRLRPQGIGLLRDAVSQGGAEAADRLAVIVAAGADGPPDWRAAVRLLGLAAERGWAPARGQLEVLASMLGNAAAAVGVEGDTRARAAQLTRLLGDEPGLRQLLVPGGGSVLYADPRICLFPGFVTPAVCAWLIERSRGRLERARVYDAAKQTDFVDSSRTNSAAIFHGMDADLVHLMVQARMSVACAQPITHMEAPTVLHYGTGETIGHHYDFVDPAHPNYAEEIRRSGNRIITFLVYLNVGYEGGETDFPRLPFRHAGQLGEGLFFVNTLPDGQANLRTLHSGLPPARGEKWVFSQFIRNRSQL